MKAMKEDLKQSPQKPVINAFSIDVEGFIESNQQSFNIPRQYINQTRENHEIERNTDVLLGLLSEVKVKATFFLIGRLARDIPQTVKTISREGHEIGCHSYAHIRVFDVGRDELKEKLSVAKHQLEDISGRQVYGFRAPDFSITQKSLWAIDVLKELGFVYDSSIYPIGMHNVYGIKNTLRTIYSLPNGLIEVPMSVEEIFGRRVPFGGGGYFRLYPLFISVRFARHLNKQNIPCISYIHPYEVGSEIPMIKEISFCRKFRHYYNCSRGYQRTKKWLQKLPFAPIIDVLKHEEFYR